MTQFPLALTFDDVLLVPGKGEKFEPKKGEVSSYVTKKIKLEQPIIATGMPTVCESEMAIAVAKLGGVGIIHPFLSYEDYALEIEKVKRKKLLVGGAVADGDIKRAIAAYKANADFIAIDAGKGYTKTSLAFIREVKSKFPKLQIMSGFFVTAEGTEAAIKNGADAVRVGIGPGSHCTTRVVAGAGYPQLTAIVNCAKATNKYKIPLIATGGIRNPGDVTKAVAAGALAVEIGGLFAGTDESPGEIVTIDGKSYKETWGYSTQKADKMADIRYMSKDITVQIKQLIKRLAGISNREDKETPSYKIIEGVEEARVAYKGSVEEVFKSLSEGLKLGMAYCGVETISELQKKAKFIRITQAGIIEGFPHGVIAQ